MQIPTLDKSNQLIQKLIEYNNNEGKAIDYLTSDTEMSLSKLMGRIGKAHVKVSDSL